MVPAMVRTAPEPTPHFSIASQGARAELGVSGQPQVVVRRKVDDLAAVEARDRKLLGFEHAQFLVELLLAQFVEFVSQILQLSFGHKYPCKSD